MSQSDKNIEIWRLKKLIKTLEAAKGNGKNMLSLIVRPPVIISRVERVLAAFLSGARIMNHRSVLEPIISAQRTFQHYVTLPPSNGLVLYAGTIVTDDGKTKKVTVDFEPSKPIKASLIRCDSKFHTQPLYILLESDENKFGFIVMDGNGTLFGTSSGYTSEVLHKFTVDKMEERLEKTAELATQFFINPATSEANVSGLILAASAYFKPELSMFDPHLQAKICNVVDVFKGGEDGFRQAIELSRANVIFFKENRLLGKYYEEVSKYNGKFVFGVDETLKTLEMGAVEILIVWENLDINRYVLKNSTTDEMIVKHLDKCQEGDARNFRDAETNAELEVEGKTSLLEWLAVEYKRFGCTLEFVTNESREGSQFCQGFGGIGGILRYELERSFDDMCLSDDDDDWEIIEPDQHRGAR